MVQASQFVRFLPPKHRSSVVSCCFVSGRKCPYSIFPVKTTVENRNSNSVFQCLAITKDKNLKLKFEFRFLISQENAKQISTFQFRFPMSQENGWHESPPHTSRFSLVVELQIFCRGQIKLKFVGPMKNLNLSASVR